MTPNLTEFKLPIFLTIFIKINWKRIPPIIPIASIELIWAADKFLTVVKNKVFIAIQNIRLVWGQQR